MHLPGATLLLAGLHDHCAFRTLKSDNSHAGQQCTPITGFFAFAMHSPCMRNSGPIWPEHCRRNAKLRVEIEANKDRRKADARQIIMSARQMRSHTAELMARSKELSLKTAV
jgi:hypothetical protein